jgi:hypothetical protein
LAQNAAIPSDALLDLLVWGVDRGVDVTAYTPELNAELERILRRSRAYESQCREPVRSSELEMLHAAQVRYERLLVSMADDTRAPALPATYVDQLRPCYEWEGYHDCPEREASFAIDYMKMNPDGHSWRTCRFSLHIGGSVQPKRTSTRNALTRPPRAGARTKRRYRLLVDPAPCWSVRQRRHCWCAAGAARRTDTLGGYATRRNSGSNS